MFKFVNFMKVPSADSLAIQQLEEFERELLTVEAHQEHYAARREALKTGIKRLSNRIKQPSVGKQHV